MRTTTFTRTRIVSLVVLAAIFVVLALLPTFYHGYWITEITDILRYAVLTVGWVIFSGPTGYMSLATAAFFGLGFYIAAVFNGPLPFVLVIIISGAIAFIVAMLVGALTLRLRGVYFAIFTFALVLLVNSVVLEVERLVTGTRGRFVEQESTNVAYWAMLIVFAFTLVCAVAIRRSRYGLALQSIGEYEEAAAHSGINVVRTKVLIFATSAFFMGMAGAIIATRRSYIDPGIAFNMNTSFLPVLMAMFGGMGNLVGPVVGAAVFTYLGDYLLSHIPDLFMLIFGVVLILAILFMPNGIIGLAQQAWRKIRGGGGKQLESEPEGGRRAPAGR
ncbi:MAG: branched-chain amino acid ABC transporter permease [Actinobacteria bacterium]|nr:branched-chain amino acid ABC transporter permease [Actinomycetota bacterium]